MSTEPRLKTIIVEDNFSLALELEMVLIKMGHKILATVDNSGDALVEILAKQPELILMDIDIKGKLSGLDIADKIAHLNIPVIFVTSYADEEHFDRASEIPNTTYITKPADEYTIKGAINLLKMLNRAVRPSDNRSGIKLENNLLYLKRNSDYIKVDIDDILYVESSNIYCKTVTKENGNFLNRLTLNEYKSILQSGKFIRPHRSFIANQNNISKVNLNDNTIVMDKHLIPISRNAKKEMKESLMMIT